MSVESIDDARRRQPRQQSGRVPPSDDGAEVALLGCAVLPSRDALRVLAEQVDPSDFHNPNHAQLAASLARLWHEGHDQVDGVVAAAAAREDVGASSVDWGQLVTSLITRAGVASMAHRYVERIVETAVERRLVAAGAEVVELGYTEGIDPAEKVDRARAAIGAVDVPVHEGAPSATVGDLLASETTYDWLVRGLLERGDRLMLTGGEGYGKSTLIAQLAVQLAAGIHPFTLERIDPLRVLVVDAENTENQLRRRFRDLVPRARGLDESLLRIECRPGGLDLTTRADVAWLTERVASNRPDVLFCGPLYLLHPPADGKTRDEALAWKVATAFKRVIARYGCALVLEAHSPHEAVHGRRDLRPIGSSLWRRWPEFGFGLDPDKDQPKQLCELRAWRGPREEREWPRFLSRGRGRWPWCSLDASG